MKTLDHKLKDGIILTAFDRDHIGSMVAKTNYYYEGAMLDYINLNIPKGTMIDVGANIGNHSIFFAKYCATGVISFEPFPETFKVLEKNIKQNNINNIRAICVGLSDEPKDELMYLPNENNVGMAKIDPSGNVSIKVINFDESIKKALCDRVTLIKIDCEGYESKAIAGMIETIKEHKPALFIECQTIAEFTVVNSILSPLGYRSKSKFNATPTYYFKYEI